MSWDPVSKPHVPSKTQIMFSLVVFKNFFFFAAPKLLFKKVLFKLIFHKIHLLEYKSHCFRKFIEWCDCAPNVAQNTSIIPESPSSPLAVDPLSHSQLQAQSELLLVSTS